MVWITKREIAYYFILKQIFKDQIFNLGEAIDVLTLFGSKRVARKTIRMLTSRGLLEKVEIHHYRVRELESTLLHNLKAYLIQRIYKRLKSLGLNVDLVTNDNVKQLAVYGCDDKLRFLVKSLNNFVEVNCY